MPGASPSLLHVAFPDGLRGRCLLPCPDVELRSVGLQSRVLSLLWCSEVNPGMGSVHSMVKSEPKWPMVPASLSRPAFLCPEMSRGAFQRTLSPNPLVFQHHQQGGRWASKPSGAAGNADAPRTFQVPRPTRLKMQSLSKYTVSSSLICQTKISCFIPHLPNSPVRL